MRLRQSILACALSAISVMAWPHNARSIENSVVVESRTVAPGQTDVTVGIYISNAGVLEHIVVPLEIRTLTNGAFITKAYAPVPAVGGRMHESILTQDVCGAASSTSTSTTNRIYPVIGGYYCSGPIAQTYEVPGAGTDGISPDGFLFAAAQQCEATGVPPYVEFGPGSEVPGVNTPSLQLRFDVGMAEGHFVIDTCCVRPANHLSFQETGFVVTTPQFTRGIIAVGAPPALENFVVVESKEVIPGQTNVRIGVYISNADPIVALVIPLELRTLSTAPPYSFRADWILNNQVNYQGRLYYSPLGYGYPIPGVVTIRKHPLPVVPNTCSGPLSSTYYAYPSQFNDDTSPDGTLLACFSQGDPNAGDDIHLSPGSEIPGRDTASYYIQVNVNSVPGQFVIDTCCVLPGNHLTYADVEGNLIPVSFTPGIVTIGCFCRCHGDPDCNGYLDIVDVVRTVNTAFRGLASITDQDCTHARTDVDANAMTNVLDVARMIDVVFGGQAEAGVFVNPCAL